MGVVGVGAAGVTAGDETDAVRSAAWNPPCRDDVAVVEATGVGVSEETLALRLRLPLASPPNKALREATDPGRWIPVLATVACGCCGCVTGAFTGGGAEVEADVGLAPTEKDVARGLAAGLLKPTVNPVLGPLRCLAPPGP